ncbi:RHS repeat domain-containing protein [Microbispora sp. H10836]|uniref:RHS repeat domain-containing protein n=1 Tax=Microbispora sp. H10836 TaxID=2729106 RepID=UPI001474924C|nr:RHS repeat protein [Microbispora sp. H10836]
MKTSMAQRRGEARSGRPRRTLRPGRLSRAVAAGMAAALTVTLTVTLSPPVTAAAAGPGRPKVDQPERTVAGRDLPARPRRSEPVGAPPPPALIDWPAADVAEADVPGRGAARAGTLPISLLPAAGAGTQAGRVRVRLLDRTAGRRAGADGIAFTVASSDAKTTGRVGVRLDYGRFAQAYGGSYGSRLRLWRLPSCALTSPGLPQCAKAAPLHARNDAAAGTLTTEVDAEPGGTLLVAAAGESGSQGDYSATSLSASATWEMGGNSGEFTWSYPMRVPPVPGELQPELAITYSSGSVDGRTGNTNAQPSWVGEGFDLWPGYIERRYKSCEDDGAAKDEFGNYPGDQCWGYDNATVTWNGRGGELIKAADGTWRTKFDDGTVFEKLTGATNGDDDGEYWKATTVDGIQYYFGLNRVPGWASGDPESDSAWTAPVFGDDSGEPCHKSSGFSSSWCQQAHRWNLDYVVGPDGNAITYTYGKEINHYGRDLKAGDETPYTRGGYLKSISYGLRKDDLFATAPARVLFTTSERCLPDASFACDPDKIGDKPQYWWDVPWDLHCDAGQECKGTHGAVTPTFWSRKRLTKVTTQVIKADGTGYRDVDSWSLGHTWGLADVERDLLLSQIQHTGHVGGTPVTLPKVSFTHVQLPNRLDRTGDDILAYIRYRLGAIYDESGGQLDIAYSGADCSLSDLPTPETNTRRCFPVIWKPPGHEDEITDWFHKYVVTSVTRIDRTGLAPDMRTSYDYLGGAAWHFDDDDGLTREKHKTWSQWRGYGQVRTLTGTAAQSDTFYLRGMDGDRKSRSGGSKSVTVSDGEGGTYTDHDALSGFELKTVEYTGRGGTVHAKTVRTPWRVTTATRTRSWGTTTAEMTAPATERTWTVKDGGGWTETRTETEHEGSGPGIGRAIRVNDLGDVTTSADDRCTRATYADNVAAHLVSLPARVETVAVACTATVDRAKDVISDIRTYYDNGALGAAPSRGDPTKVEEIASHDGTKATYATEKQVTYDVYGRPLEATNALGQTSTTVYTDARGLTTKVTTTSPPAKPGDASTALVTVQELDPAWGQQTAEIDANGLRTELVYDGLGRLRQVWLPNRSKGSNPYPNYEFDYRVTDDKIVAVTTKTLTATGGQRIAGIELLDGWLRTRQTQAPGPTGRLITDTIYDDRGLVVRTHDAYPASGAPEPVLFGVLTPGNIESQTRTEYDGLGRKTLERLMAGNGSQPEQEKWRTTYSYGGGNRTSVTPPQGGTPTAEITDARGQVIERRQYKAAGQYDAIRYTYTPTGEPASVTDPSGNTWTNTYDLRGRKIKTVDPDKGPTSYTYDDLDRETSVTDARGKKTVTTYDGLGRKTDTREGSATGTRLTSFTYDSVPLGKGKPATATRHHAGADYTSEIRHYDRLGRADVNAVTIPSAQGALAGTYVFSTSYNLDGTVQGQGLPAAGGLAAENLVSTYDDFLRPVRLTGNLGTYVGATDYTPTGKLMMLEFGATTGKRAWQTFTYEWATQRPATTRTLRENVSGSDRDATYRYDDAGNIRSIADASRDGADTQCFSYDPLRRLTEAWTQTTATCDAAPPVTVAGGPAPYWQTFGYDTAGNRVSETRHGVAGQPDTVRTYTYSPAGQGNRLTKIVQSGGGGSRTDTYAYDDTGNTITRTAGGTTQTFDWDVQGQLSNIAESGAAVEFVYDADGNRLIRKDATAATLYLPGTEVRLSAGTTTATRYYTHAGRTVALRTTTGVTYLTEDHQGTAQIAIDAQTQQSRARRLAPFGAERSTPPVWPGEKGFVGGTKDPAGLMQLGVREYDPDIGRFISVDPVLDLTDAQQMNGYTYANSSPVTNSDPDGKLCRRVNGDMECSNGDGVVRVPTKRGYKVIGPSGPPCYLVPRACGWSPSVPHYRTAPPPRTSMTPPIPALQPYVTPPPPSFWGDLRDVNQPLFAASLGSATLGELVKLLGLGSVKLEDKLLAGLGLTKQQVETLRRTFALVPRAEPKHNLRWKAAKRAGGLSRFGEKAATFGKWAGRASVAVSVVDGGYAQFKADRNRDDLSGKDKTARVLTRGFVAGAGAHLGSMAGYKAGAGCFALAVICAPIGSIAGGAAGGAVGSAAGGSAARYLFGG